MTKAHRVAETTIALVLAVTMFRDRHRRPVGRAMRREQMAKFSRLLWAVLIFVAKPALAENFTYKQYSASSEGWKRAFVFAVAQHQTTINPGEGPPYPTTRAFQRCLSGAGDAMLEQQVKTYVARNPSSLTEPMVVVVLKTLRDLCRSEIEKATATANSAGPA